MTDDFTALREAIAAGPENGEWAKFITVADHATISALLAKLDRYKKALERLGSNATFTLPFVNDQNNPAAAELSARMEFARNTLEDKTP